MALAAAVMKAVNSSLYGLRGRVQTVHRTLTYLGMREIVATITFEMGLRPAISGGGGLEPVWGRAAKRGLLMGRMGQMLGVDPGPPSAGLFEGMRQGRALPPCTPTTRHAARRYATPSWWNWSARPLASAMTPWAPRCAKLGPGAAVASVKHRQCDLNDHAEAMRKIGGVSAVSMIAGP